MAFMGEKITYHNNLAEFQDPHTVLLKDEKGEVVKKVKAKYIIIAVGGRPNYGDWPNSKELCISSDDIFSLKDQPGKILVVGASYIALECAGFLHTTGSEVEVMMRSILLRGFDQDMALLIQDFMEKKGIPFLTKCVPVRFDKLENGKIQVTYKNQEGAENKKEYDNVLLAVGRVADTAGLNIQAADVKIANNGKVICNEQDQSISQSHIYAIGDVQDGKPELTPVAIQAGKLLSKRLFQGSNVLMDYLNVPTTVFTPLEYSCCGYSEEKAIEIFTLERLEIFHAKFKPLEWQIMASHAEDFCYTKIICDKQEDLKIIGIHFLGPQAGEVMQGFALAIKCGITYEQLQNTVGIHPTCAEEVVRLDITKSSGQTAEKTGC